MPPSPSSLRVELEFLSTALEMSLTENPEFDTQVHAAAETLARTIHQYNVDAGWWTDLATNESILGKRNVGEMLLLVITELVEAQDGMDQLCPDDKLPHRAMHEVEIADSMIRVFDLAGALVPNFGATLVHAIRHHSGIDEPTSIWFGATIIARGFEDWRKQRMADFYQSLGTFIVWCLLHGRYYDLALPEAFEEKLIFNQTRADHKLENRRLKGGKRV